MVEQVFRWGAVVLTVLVVVKFVLLPQLPWEGVVGAFGWWIALLPLIIYTRWDDNRRRHRAR